MFIYFGTYKDTNTGELGNFYKKGKDEFEKFKSKDNIELKDYYTHFQADDISLKFI